MAVRYECKYFALQKYLNPSNLTQTMQETLQLVEDGTLVRSAQKHNSYGIDAKHYVWWWETNNKNHPQWNMMVEKNTGFGNVYGTFWSFFQKHICEVKHDVGWEDLAHSLCCNLSQKLFCLNNSQPNQAISLQTLSSMLLAPLCSHFMSRFECCCSVMESHSTLDRKQEVLFERSVSFQEETLKCKDFLQFLSGAISLTEHRMSYIRVVAFSATTENLWLHLWFNIWYVKC